ncbi:unnamed protein product, partial [Prorocentrum cordatum]
MARCLKLISATTLAARARLFLTSVAAIVKSKASPACWWYSFETTPPPSLTPSKYETMDLENVLMWDMSCSASSSASSRTSLASSGSRFWRHSRKAAAGAAACFGRAPSPRAHAAWGAADGPLAPEPGGPAEEAHRRLRLLERPEHEDHARERLPRPAPPVDDSFEPGRRPSRPATTPPVGRRRDSPPCSTRRPPAPTTRPRARREVVRGGE